MVGGDLVGVNQRDLVTFEVDQERAIRMAPQMPAGVVRVAESGVRDRSDAAALAEAGYHALLVGETLVTSGDPAEEIRRLRGLADAKVVAPPERASSFHRVFVKICGVTSEEDGLLAVGMGAGDRAELRPWVEAPDRGRPGP